MLEELRIRNFAIITHLELDFAPGFNVITGETGAGKSIIVDAVELLLGGKSDNGSVRAGADRAVVEGVFRFDERSRAELVPLLMREELMENENDEFVTLTRELRQNGRSSARINGITVNADLLREVGEVLVDIHGQSAHLSLFKPRHHLDLIDRYADLLEVRDALGQVVETLNGVRREIKYLREDEAALKRRADMLDHEIEEIDAAALEPGEDEDLKAERNRLSNSEQLANLTAEAVLLLNGDDDSGDQLPAVDQLMQVATLMGKLSKIDPDLEEGYSLAESISEQAQELAISMGRYADTIEYNPDRLNDVEERLELINQLKRRYSSPTIEGILAYADKAREELNGIENSEERLQALEKEETKLLRHIGELCQRMSKSRIVAGRKLGAAVVKELQDLRMERTRFEVSIAQVEDPTGCYVGDKRYAFDTSGMDQLEFMMSANPGQPLRPLAKVASGGEAARIMLALKRVLSQADHTPILIFDEIDQGIGGRVGAIVGEKLWALSDGHQVLVVTHLPQLAGYGDTHYHVRKSTDGRQTATEVNMLLTDDERVRELADMLGTPDDTGRQSARNLLNEARHRKGALRPT